MCDADIERWWIFFFPLELFTDILPESFYVCDYPVLNIYTALHKQFANFCRHCCVLATKVVSTMIGCIQHTNSSMKALLTAKHHDIVEFGIF